MVTLSTTYINNTNCKTEHETYEKAVEALESEMACIKENNLTKIYDFEIVRIQKNNTPFENRRDAHLELYEVGETISSNEYSYRLQLSITNKTITNKEFLLLWGSFQLYCINNKINN